MAVDKKLENALPEGFVVKSGKNIYRVVKVTLSWEQSSGPAALVLHTKSSDKMELCLP